MTLQEKLDDARAEGYAEGIELGRAEARAEELARLVRDGLLDVAVAAQRAGMAEERMRELAASV